MACAVSLDGAVLRRLGLSLAIVAASAVPLPGAAETYRLVGPDGTVHLTNARAGPGYEKVGQQEAPTPAVPRVSAARDHHPDPGSYRRAIREASRRHNIPENLVRAIIQVESRFDPRAVSPKGARGLMQLMPATASLLGVHDPHDPEQNIDGGVRHLLQLMNRFSDDLPLALAAYHAGEAAVAVSRGVPPYPDTREYVTRVLRVFKDFAHSGLLRAGVQGPENDDETPRAETSSADDVTRLPGSIYRVRQADGTTLYTNIPRPLPR